MFPSYRNQSIDLHSKSIDWFLYEDKTGTLWANHHLRNPLSVLPYWAGRYFCNVHEVYCGGLTFSQLRCSEKGFNIVEKNRSIDWFLYEDKTGTLWANHHLRNPLSVLPYWAGRYFCNVHEVYCGGLTFSQLRCSEKGFNIVEKNRSNVNWKHKQKQFSCLERH